MKYINISHASVYSGTLKQASGELSETFSAKNLLTETGYWCTQKKEFQKIDHVIIDYNNVCFVDHIILSPSSTGKKTFPQSFRFEGSYDGETWKTLHSEEGYELEEGFYEIVFPITSLRYLKLVILESSSINGQYYCELGSIKCGITGLASIEVSTISQQAHSAEAMLLQGPDNYWESEIKSNSTMESVLLDLGRICAVNKIILGASTKGFPEDFSILISSDSEIWTPIVEERAFKAEPFKGYFWELNSAPARYIRIEGRSVRYFENQYAMRLTGVKVFAAAPDLRHTHSFGELTNYASVFQPGIVKLARDGESVPGAAVQGSDRRLRDATTIFKGIVQFAKDGDEQEGTAVQASDMRLKPATESMPGIVRLAYDREIFQGAVVQSDDSRLKEATEENFGIVKLCPPGLYSNNAVLRGDDPRIQQASTSSAGICMLAENGANKSGTVVQADDRRLRNASTQSKGIVELADDGEGAEGVVVQGNDRRLRHATTKSKGIVELAEDGEDAEGVVVQGNDRRLKDATTQSKGIVELAENGEDRPGVVVQGNDRRLKDATTQNKGIVELAENGEDRPGVAVQGSDRRLKNATETSSGIVRLAADGEDKALSVVQASDRRLKDATTQTKGIVELAEDGEDRPGVVVQGNDRRLKDATTQSKGIVELAENGEDRPGVAVQGNDRRLKDATENSAGVMRFASDGEAVIMAAVQGNDRRLRDATTQAKGIIELAEDGEDAEGVVVQGNDRRLKNATTQAKGIVELAEDGEDAEGVAVQGNDSRLKDATTEIKGIVRLAKNNESRPGLVVQSHDERLYDAREPLSHTHDYAPRSHDFNSHKGTLSIKGSKSEIFYEIVPPSDDSSVIHGHNDADDSGAIGIAGIAGKSTNKDAATYGIVGHSPHVGVRGQSSGGEKIKGCGILGVSRFGSGGLFISEHNHSLIADGYGNIEDYDNTINLVGNGDALLVRGKSEFEGQVHIKNSNDEGSLLFPLNIVEFFEVDDEEFISPGDLLVIKETGKSILSRSRTEYNRAVAGVVSGNPAVILNNSGVEKKVYPVVLAGKAFCKVDARNKPVNPGDLIVTSSTPGCGMAGKINSFDHIGTVVGKALDALEDGIDLIPIFIIHQ